MCVTRCTAVGVAVSQVVCSGLPNIGNVNGVGTSVITIAPRIKFTPRYER